MSEDGNTGELNESSGKQKFPDSRVAGKGIENGGRRGELFALCTEPYKNVTECKTSAPKQVDQN